MVRHGSVQHTLAWRSARCCDTMLHDMAWDGQQRTAPEQPRITGFDVLLRITAGEALPHIPANRRPHTAASGGLCRRQPVSPPHSRLMLGTALNKASSRIGGSRMSTSHGGRWWGGEGVRLGFATSAGGWAGRRKRSGTIFGVVYKFRCIGGFMAISDDITIYQSPPHVPCFWVVKPVMFWSLRRPTAGVIRRCWLKLYQPWVFWRIDPCGCPGCS